MNSIWTNTVNIKERPSLPGNLSTDIVVIGAGMAGILTAHFLRRLGREVIVLESSRIASGQTKNTTAKISVQHNLIYDWLLTKFGEKEAKQYYHANMQAVSQFLYMEKEYQIPCHMKVCPSYLYTTQDTKPLRQELMALQRIGVHAELTKDTTLPFEVTGALKLEEQAMFHPLEFLDAVAKPLTIYEHTPVLSVNDHSIHTPHGTVTAKHIIFTTHFPFLNAPGYYFLRMHQERSYVIALKNAAKLDGTYLGIDENSYSLRNYEDLLLFGGGGHRTGENPFGHQYDALEINAMKYWPESTEVARWSAQDCMTADHVPYIGPYSASTPDWYVATGFRKWGMTGSMVSAMVLSHLLTKREYPFGEVFSPQRLKFWAAAKSLTLDSAHAIKGLTKDLVPLSKDAAPRCPHLGCRLEWNPDEQSFDCPCHGSRFAHDGTLLDNPAQENLQL